MATVKKRKLSESTDGAPIAVSSAATYNTIHTAVAGTTAGSYDEVWIWAQNLHSADVVLTMRFGGLANKDKIMVTIPFQSGLVPVIPGLPLQNGKLVTATAATANLINLVGFVNSITD